MDRGPDEDSMVGDIADAGYQRLQPRWSGRDVARVELAGASRMARWIEAPTRA